MVHTQKSIQVALSVCGFRLIQLRHQAHNVGLSQAVSGVFSATASVNTRWFTDLECFLARERWGTEGKAARRML